MNTGATTTVKSIVTAFGLAKMRREMERRRQRVDELYAITSVASAAPSPASSASLSSSASSTTSSAPMSAVPTSIDTTTLSPTTTRELLHTPPARCSTPGRSHGERALAPVTAVPTSLSTLATASSASDASAAAPATSPARCSTNCLSVNVDMFKTVNTFTATLVAPPMLIHFFADPLLGTNQGYSFEFSQIRYITKDTTALSGGVMFEMASAVHGDQTSQDNVILEFPPAILVDKGKGLPILYFDQLSIPPKPPWSLLCLEDGSCHNNIATPLLPWTHHLVLIDSVQLRPAPWPSFDFPTVVQLQKGLTISWHLIQCMKLCHNDRKLFHLATESFWLVVQFSISLPVEPLHAQVLSKASWQPPQYHCNIFPCQTPMPCFNLWLSFSGDLVNAQHQLLWPSTLLRCDKLLNDSVQLSDTIAVCCLVTQCMVTLGKSGECLQHWPVWGTAVQVNNIKWKNIGLPRFTVDPLVYLQPMKGHVTLFPSNASLATLQTVCVKITWMLWEIPWKFSPLLYCCRNRQTAILNFHMLWQCYTNGFHLLIFSEKVCQALALRWSSGLGISCKFLISQHIKQDIWVISAYVFHIIWMESFKLGVHSGVYDIVLHRKTSEDWRSAVSLKGIIVHHESLSFALLSTDKVQEYYFWRWLLDWLFRCLHIQMDDQVHLSDCFSLHLVPPTIISAQEYWLASLQYLFRWLWTVSMIRQKCKFIFSYRCSVIANIQWPRLLSAIGQKNYGVPSVEMAAETLASSIIPHHIIILSSTASLYKHEYELSANQNSRQGNELNKCQNLLHIQESSSYRFLAGINYYQMMLPWDPGKDKHPPGGHKYPGCLMRMTLGHVTLHFIKNCVTPIVWDAGQAQLKHGELLGIHLCGNFNMAAATVQTDVLWDVISTALTMVRWMGIYLPSLAHISSGCTSTSHWYGKIEHYSTIQHAMMLLLFTWPILTVGRVLDNEDFCEQATLVYLLSSQGCKAMMCGGNAVQKHQLATGFHPFSLAPGLQLQKLLLGELQHHQAFKSTGASPFTEPTNTTLHHQIPHNEGQFKLQFYGLVIEDP